MSEEINFAAQVAEEIRAFEGGVLAVFIESVQELVELAQSYAPVVTSFLVNSMEASLTEMPAVDPKKHGEDGAGYQAASISAEIIGDGFGVVLYIGWTAAYAARIEFGFTGEDSLGRNYTQAAQAFVRRAAQDWEGIVKRNEDRLLAGLRA